MKHVILFRERTGDQGTFGTLTVMETGWSCVTAELPWRENRRGVSCIPQRAYVAQFVPKTTSGKFKNVYHLLDVPGRDGILVHSGNYAGDVDKGFRSDINGCILVGERFGELQGQQVVLSSKPAMLELIKQLGQEPAKFFIWDRTGV